MAAKAGRHVVFPPQGHGPRSAISVERSTTGRRSVTDVGCRLFEKTGRNTLNDVDACIFLSLLNYSADLKDPKSCTLIPVGENYHMRESCC